jgi:hypothetical protein
MAIFKDFGSFTKKLRSKVKDYALGVNDELIEQYSAPDRTGLVTGYLRSAFKVDDKPGSASSVRTEQERRAAGVTQVDVARLKAELRSSTSNLGVIHHYNQAFYSGVQELDKFTYRAPLNNFKSISSKVAAGLVKK